MGPTTDPVPVAGSDLVRDLVTGPERGGRVLGVFPTAVYVRVDGSRDVLALETTDALRLPTALVLAADVVRDPFAGIRTGDPAVVGRAAVAAGTVRTRVVRWWRPRRARPVAPPGPAAPAPVPVPAPALLPDVSPDLRDVWTALASALTGDRLPAGAVRALVGRGGGLTPEGDDLLAGLLVATAALGGHAPPRLSELPALVLSLLDRTTALSAGLLAQAVEGYAVPPVLDLVDAVGACAGVEEAVVRLVSVGHTSGAALAHGVLAGLQVPRSVPPTGSEIAS